MKARPYLRQISLRGSGTESEPQYPFSIPAIREMETITFHLDVTFFVGENGTGKSTLVEAIAVLCGLNPEGGSQNFRFSTRSSESELSHSLRMVRSFRRPRDSFFLRAESYFNLATEVERLDEGTGGPTTKAFGGRSLHKQSHRESFMSLITNRSRAMACTCSTSRRLPCRLCGNWLCFAAWTSWCAGILSSSSLLTRRSFRAIQTV
jgi:predicted ATPase